MSESETVADIAAEMRNATVPDYLFNGEEVGEPLIRGLKVCEWADRIEAACRREKESIYRMLDSSVSLQRRAEGGNRQGSRPDGFWSAWAQTPGGGRP